jgi:hypothetical protein
MEDLSTGILPVVKSTSFLPGALTHHPKAEGIMSPRWNRQAWEIGSALLGPDWLLARISPAAKTQNRSVSIAAIRPADFASTNSRLIWVVLIAFAIPIQIIRSLSVSTVNVLACCARRISRLFSTPPSDVRSSTKRSAALEMDRGEPDRQTQTVTS